jgi:hypothetical protein
LEKFEVDSDIFKNFELIVVVHGQK